MIKHVTHQMLLAIAASLAIAACATDDAPRTASSASADTVSCTPGYKTCDYACYAQGGPTTNDCIVQCNATGDGWITLQDCGWAQNLPYSSSCLDSQPDPVCQNN